MTDENKVPSVLVENVSKWYGQVIGINDVSLAIEGGVTAVSYTHLTLPTKRIV